MTQNVTFSDVTADEVWDLLIAVKIRLRKLEEMVIATDIFNEKQITEFHRELEVQRIWENRLMRSYLDDQFTVSFRLKEQSEA